MSNSPWLDSDATARDLMQLLFTPIHFGLQISEESPTPEFPAPLGAQQTIWHGSVGWIQSPGHMFDIPAVGQNRFEILFRLDTFYSLPFHFQELEVFCTSPCFCTMALSPHHQLPPTVCSLPIQIELSCLPLQILVLFCSLVQVLPTKLRTGQI